MSHRLTAALLRLRPRALVPALVVLGALVAYLLAWALYWPANGPATGIQQPLHYNESYVWPMAWTLHQAAPGVPPPAPLTLHQGDAVRQEIHAAADRLAAVRVWLAGERGGEQVQAVLRDAPSDGAPSYGAQQQAIYAGQFRLDEDGAGRHYALRFPPLSDAEGQAYVLELQAVEGTVIARVGYVDPLPGRLWLNEYPTPGNLDLTAYHRGPPGLWTARAIGQRILPDRVRARVRQYKPAVFKGATFGLLAAGLAAGVGLLLWALALPLWGRGKAGKAVGLALLGSLLAGAIVLRWDVPGMLGLSHAVHLTPEPPSQSSALPALHSSTPPASVRDLVARLAFVDRHPEPRQVHAALVEQAGRRRPCIAVPARSQVTYGLRVPYDGELRVGLAVPAEATRATVFQIQVAGHALLERTLTPGEAGAWHDVTLDLRPYAGSLVQLALSTRPADVPLGFGEPGEGPPAGGPLPVAGLWAAPHVTSARTWLLAYPLPEPPQQAQIARFGGQAGDGSEIELLGADLDWLEPAPGAHVHGALRLTLYWRALRPIDVPYTVFVHALDAGGEIQGQWDSEPLGGAYPTDVWPVGVVVRDVYTVPVGESASPDGYRLAVGLYEWATMERLPAYDEGGEPWPQERVILAVE